MTRIGFAYNQKPESSSATSPLTEAPSADAEPPSTRRDFDSRNHSSLLSPPFASSNGMAGPATLTPPAPIAAPVSDIYAEWDTPATLDAVAYALAKFGDVIRLEANADFPQRLRDARPDLVFNIAEGLYGPNRESHVPAICEFFNVPYSASDPFTLSLCLHKARTKQILAAVGVPTAPFALVETEAQLRTLVKARAPELAYPLFLKPVQEGSSKGITQGNFVRDDHELLARGTELLQLYHQPVLVEAYLPGAEFTCGVLGNGDSAHMLPPVAMRFDTLPAGAIPVYGFEAKWVWDTPEHALDIFECPARIPRTLLAQIEDVTLRAYRAVGCRDWARVDIRLDAAGQPNVIEINPLPGILPDPAEHSCLPKAARAAGLSYDELIQACLCHAAERQGVFLEHPSAR